MIVWVAVMMSCVNVLLQPEIHCSLGSSEEIYKSKDQCIKEAPRTYKNPNCISVEVDMYTDHTKKFKSKDKVILK